MTPGFIGRVPVYDRALNLFAYELRPCSLPGKDEDQLEEFLREFWQNLRLEKLTGGRQGLISLSLPLLRHLPKLPAPRDKLILNLSQTAFSHLGHDELQQLHDQGYLLACSCEQFDPKLLEQLKFVKLLAFEAKADLAGILPHVRTIHTCGLGLMLRHIETQAQFDNAFNAGFDYFQGRYFECPRLIHGTQIPANRLAVLRLIARLEDPGITIEEAETLISQDVTLSYKVLRLVNSAFYSLPRQIDSISRAVVLLGLDRIKHWAIVILVNAIDYKPRELLLTALVRAYTCEQIARLLKRSDTEQCYIAGLFSLLDAIMDAPMAEILRHLNLVDEINEALLYGSGPIGPILQTVLCLEQGLCHKIPLRDLDLAGTLNAYLEAIEMAETVRRQLENRADPIEP